MRLPVAGVVMRMAAVVVAVVVADGAAAGL